MAYIYTPPIPSSLPENFPTGGGGGGGGGTDNYNELSNKPKVNSIVLEGDKSAANLGLVDLKGIQAYAIMPDGAATGTTVMYTGSSGAYLTGAVYRKTGSGWTMIMSPAEVDTISNEAIDSLFE